MLRKQPIEKVTQVIAATVAFYRTDSQPMLTQCNASPVKPLPMAG